MTHNQHGGRRAVLVDPIFRGSRLFYTWMVAEAAIRQGFEVVIVTRTDAVTDHFDELFGDLSVRIVEAVPVPKDFWYRGLTGEELDALTAGLNEELPGASFVFFSGLNEIWPGMMHRIGDGLLPALAGIPTLIVDYDAFHIIRSRYGRQLLRWAGLKQVAKRMLRKTQKNRLIEDAASATGELAVICLDERAFDPVFGKGGKPDTGRYRFAADPGPVVAIDREKQPGADEPLTLALIGIQSARKGLVDVVRALKSGQLDDVPLRIVLSGRLEPETERFRDFLQNHPRIDWREGYFSEEVIQQTYRDADYVVLPYTPGFSGSSGVMGYAAAFATPLLTTAHGCIGYRVKRFGLGRTYRSGNVEELVSVIKSLPGRDDPAYAALRKNCETYASTRTVEDFQNTVMRTVADLMEE